MENIAQLNTAAQEAELETLKRDYLQKAEAHISLLRNLHINEIEMDGTVSKLSQSRHDAVLSYLSLSHFIARIQTSQAFG